MNVKSHNIRYFTPRCSYLFKIFGTIRLFSGIEVTSPSPSSYRKTTVQQKVHRCKYITVWYINYTNTYISFLWISLSICLNHNLLIFHPPTGWSYSFEFLGWDCLFFDVYIFILLLYCNIIYIYVVIHWFFRFAFLNSTNQIFIPGSRDWRTHFLGRPVFEVGYLAAPGLEICLVGF